VWVALSSSARHILPSCAQSHKSHVARHHLADSSSRFASSGSSWADWGTWLSATVGSRSRRMICSANRLGNAGCSVARCSSNGVQTCREVTGGVVVLTPGRFLSSAQEAFGKRIGYCAQSSPAGEGDQPVDCAQRGDHVFRVDHLDIPLDLAYLPACLILLSSHLVPHARLHRLFPPPDQPF
jgi:hypothetical protein